MSTISTTSPTAAQLAKGMIISVKEARKLLGPSYQNIKDDELTALILDMTELARDLLVLNKTNGVL